jgi:PAS domain S-box-containing protein
MNQYPDVQRCQVSLFAQAKGKRMESNQVIEVAEPSEQRLATQERPAEGVGESEWGYRAVFEHAAIGMVHTGLDGRLLLVNQCYCDIVGYSREELLRMKFQDLTHPDYVEAGLSHLRRLLAGAADTYAMEKRCIRKDGSTIWVRTTVSLIRTLSNEPAHFVAIIEDINERKQLERRTRESLEGLLQMAEAIVELPGSTGYASSASGLQGALPEVSIVGHRLVELVRSILGCQRVSITTVDLRTGELRSLAIVGISSELERQWRDRRPGFHLSELFAGSEFAGRLLNREVLVLDMTQPPLRDWPNPYGIRIMLLAPMFVGDQLVGLLVLDHGHTKHEYSQEEIALAGAIAKLAALVVERERLVQERAEACASELALREAKRRMDEFLGIASHELRTPLTTIKANVQFAGRQLKKIAVPGTAAVEDMSGKLNEAQDLLGKAERQVEVLNRLVGDLVDISRIEADKLELRLRPEPCNLVTIVREVVAVQRQVIASRPIRLTIATRKVVPIIADAGRLAQVLTNYLSNAHKYSPTGRPIEVSLRLQAGVAYVSVRDEGPGLPSTEQERIWERFYRAEGVKYQGGFGVGLGLGLYISRMIIEQHHGQVGVESARGQGSTFWFSLPLFKEPSPVPVHQKGRTHVEAAGQQEFHIALGAAHPAQH